MESGYPRPEPIRSKSWVVDIIAAILAAAIVTPGLLFLIAPKLGGVFTTLGNDRMVSYSSFVVVSPRVWWLVGGVLIALIGLTAYLRTRGPSGPKLNIKRVVWLALIFTLALSAFVAFTVLQALFMSGDVIR
jgi:hypothetical protein